MSEAKITCKEGFTCAPDGHTVVVYPHGKVVTGKVADWACAAQAAKQVGKHASKQLKPKLENKQLNPNKESK